MSRLVFLDTETTGLDPRTHQIWEIGAILRDEWGTETEYLWQIRPNLDTADPKSLEIGRFHERFLVPEGVDAVRVMEDGSLWKLALHEMLFDFQEVVRDAHLVGAVPSFDDAFLKALLQPLNRRIGWHYHLIDVETLAVGYLHGVIARAIDEARMDGRTPLKFDRSRTNPPWDSEDISRAVGVNPAKFERHTALGDARWAKAIYDAVRGDAE